MKNSILINLLSSMTRKELKKFKVFLISPFFNNKKYIINFFDKLIINYPQFKNNNFDIDEFREANNIKKSTLKSMQSKLFSLLLQYFTYTNFSKNYQNKMNILSDELVYRNQFEILTKKIKKFEKYDLANIKIDPFYFLNSFLLNANKVNIELLSNFVISKKNKSQSIIKEIDYGFKYLLVFVISIATSHYIKSKILYIDYNVEISDTAFIKFLENMDIPFFMKTVKEDKGLYNYLKIYNKLLICFKDFSNLKKYEEYEKIVLRNISEMNEDEKNFHLHNLMNYCTIPKNSIDLDILFKKKVFELYNTVLKNKYYLDSRNKYLPVSLFRSILIISVFLKKYNWADKFIINYSKMVPPEHIQNINYYSLAYLYNAKSDFYNSLEYIYKIKIDRFIYKFDARDLHLKLLYDINDYESVLESIHNYKDFLRNSKFTTKEIKSFRGNFIKILEKLTYFKCGNSKIDIGYLYNNIQKESQISNKNWLLDKVKDAIDKKIISSPEIVKKPIFKNNKFLLKNFLDIKKSK